MRCTVTGFIAGEVRESVSKTTGARSYNHPVFVPGTNDSRAEVFEAYAKQAHPAWSEAANDGRELEFEVDIAMRSYNGREFQSVTLLSVKPATAAKPAAQARQ